MAKFVLRHSSTGRSQQEDLLARVIHLVHYADSHQTVLGEGQYSQSPPAPAVASAPPLRNAETFSVRGAIGGCRLAELFVHLVTISERAPPL